MTVLKTHERAFDTLRQKQGPFLVVQRHICEMYERFERDPQGSLGMYEKVISKKYLASCESPAQLYLFLLFKLSLSEFAREKNVLVYQWQKVQETYDMLPARVRETFLLGEVVASREKKDQFLEAVMGAHRNLYLPLASNIEAYERLEAVSKEDEELEEEAGRVMMERVEKDLTGTERFLSNLEEFRPTQLDSYVALFFMQPTLEAYLTLYEGEKNENGKNESRK